MSSKRGEQLKSQERRASTPGSASRSRHQLSNSDRFIPNRSKMNVDIMRQEVFTAEKRRIEAIDKNISFQRGAENGDPNTPNTPTQSERRGQILTPLQAEFRSRMRGALLNIPLDDSTTLTQSSAYSFGQVSEAVVVTPNISNFTTPESKRNAPKKQKKGT